MLTKINKINKKMLPGWLVDEMMYLMKNICRFIVIGLTVTKASAEEEEKVFMMENICYRKINWLFVPVLAAANKKLKVFSLVAISSGDEK